MKIMSGYDTSKQPDYKKQVDDELVFIESKVIQFNDLLNKKQPGHFSVLDGQIEVHLLLSLGLPKNYTIITYEITQLHSN